MQPMEPLQLPGSRIVEAGEVRRFVNDPHSEGYTNAQLDDYRDLRRRSFLHRAPLHLTVRARFSSRDLVGTAGFGFWNDPFLMTGARLPALPRAIWFFHGGPANNLKLDRETPGNGWKAATVDAIRLPFFLLAPTAPLAVPLMNVKPLYRALWPVGQRAIGVSEAALPGALLTEWHTYTIEWGRDRAVFAVDGGTVLESPTPPRGRLGFVMWIDNQAMTVTPWGQFGWRVVPIERQQWLEVSDLRIEAG